MAQLRIEGHVYTVTDPYKAGDILSATDALALNRARAEAVGNAARAKQAGLVRKNEAKLSPEALQAFITDYASEYTFGTREVNGDEVTDPVERILRELLIEHVVKPAVKSRNLAIAEIGGTKKLYALAAELMNSTSPKLVETVTRFREEAERRVAQENQMRGATANISDLFDLATIPSAGTGA